MARLARKSLADMRAMEEQNARVRMHGSGRIVGAGATPSMGLSQFRGGAHNEDSSSDDEGCGCGCKMCGGAGSTAIVRYRPPVRGGPVGRPPVRPPTGRPPVGELVPYLPPGDIVPYYPGGRLPAKPSMPIDWYENLFRPKPGAPKPGVGAPKAPVLTAAQKAQVARLLAMGVPLAAMGAYLGAAFNETPVDSGYYDDYVDPDVIDSGTGDGTGDGTGNVIDTVTPVEPRPRGPVIDYVPDVPTELMPSGLSKKEVKFYLQSGNLPDRFYSGLQQKLARRQGLMGSGKSDGRSNRAEIVRKVMKEKGMKLIEASKYVKEHGLYKK